MDIELSVSNAHIKRRVIETLTEGGYQARSGHVRLAYPFSVLVEDVDAVDQETVRRLVARVDPRSGRILTREAAQTS